MLGLRSIAVTLVVTIIFGNVPARGQTSVPVLSLKQPERIAKCCGCDCCGLGLPCTKSEGQPPSVAATPPETPPTLTGATELVSYGWLLDDESSSPQTDVATPLVTEPVEIKLASHALEGCDGAGCPGTASRCHHCGGKCADLCCGGGFWIRADYLMWWTQDDQIPTLVTSSPQGTPIGDVGVLGLPTTDELFTGPISGDFRNGGRLRFGWWDDQRQCGIAGSFWGTENLRDGQGWSSAGDPAYARPFTNVDPLVRGQDAELVSFENTLAGSVHVGTSSEVFGGDLGILHNLWCCQDSCGQSGYRVDLYAGYRYLKLREGVLITENLESIATGGPVAQGTTTELFDKFETRNEFHGANLGITASKQRGRWTAELSTLLGIGALNRNVRIDGETAVTVPTQPAVVRRGGLLTQETNMGSYEDSTFTVIPELRADLGYCLTPHSKLLIGYSFMYLGNVVRPGDTIDEQLNGLQLDPFLPLVGPERPRFDWNDSSLWVMGLNLGMEFSF